MTQTIFALSSGRPPAAIAVLRISGPGARAACIALAGALPPPRRASLRTLRGDDGGTLDQALVLFFPAPATATGEDLVEFHLHGGRAVVAAVEAALLRLKDVVRARPGEFTRRALTNGRLDLAQTEGLADLLEAETETQRRAALAAAEGAVSRHIEAWLDRVSALAARVEADIDFADEGDVAAAPSDDLVGDARTLATEMQRLLDRPSVERLRDGVSVVIAGPRNAGKSSLFNALLGRDAAIVTPIAGTTRDVLEASVVRQGTPYRVVDTAGLVAETADPVERIGIERARLIVQSADILLWLGPASDAPAGAIIVRSRSDLRANDLPEPHHLSTSVHDPASIDRLWAVIAERAAGILDHGAGLHINARQHDLVRDAAVALRDVGASGDPLIDAEHLRVAGMRLATLLGRDATQSMLDALFGRFCLGK